MNFQGNVRRNAESDESALLKENGTEKRKKKQNLKRKKASDRA